MAGRVARPRFRWTSTGATLLTIALWSGCGDDPGSPVDPGVTARQAVVQGQEVPIDRAIEAQERNGGSLMAIPGVVGHGVGLGENGEPEILVFTLQPGATGVPASLEGIPTRTVVSGRFVAMTDETAKHRPAPLGVSIGHPDITAGTLGFKVKDALGNPFILSNNHVMANRNDATVGDDIYQPGPYDGGGATDKIATLADFVPLDFGNGDNVVDAAIASINPDDVLSTTPTDEGYGQPSSTTVVATLGMDVQKYGRTTEHTHGSVSTINATVDVCYEPIGYFGCAKSAHFVGQFLITPGTFSAGGDSGSGIVTDDGNLNPVGLLFAGSSSYTVANPIDDVLSAFGVTIDDGNAGPPSSLTDIEIANVSAPASTTGGEVVAVTVAVRNAGNQDVGASFEVTLADATDGDVVGSQSVSGLTAGSSTSLEFSWNTTGASFGDHMLAASHDFVDERPTNDSRSTTVEVYDPNAPSGVHIGDLDALESGGGGLTYWSTEVVVSVHGPNHQPVNGATVVGTWSGGGFVANTCTTGEAGTCSVLSTLIDLNAPSVTFTVTSVTLSGETYRPGENHDVEGDSDGTSVTGYNPDGSNTAPTANDVSASGAEDAGSIGWTPDVGDPDGDALTCSIAAQPASGTASVSVDCSAGTYTPDADFNGPDTFTYAVSDGSAADQGTVSVTVSPTDDAPTATGESYAATVGATLVVPAPGVLANDGDADGDVLTAVLDAEPSNDPSFALNGDGSFSYTPDGAGSDSFTYHAFDGALSSSVVTVTFDVTEPSAGVTVTDVDPGTVAAGQSVDVVISGSGFVEGATVTFEGGSGPVPTVSNIVVVGSSEIAATIEAKGGGPRRDRVWDVRVTNPDGSSDVLAGGFTVTR